jgi:hypothetical protein
VVEKFKYLGTTLTHKILSRKKTNSSVKSGNASYHSVQTLLSSSLLYRGADKSLARPTSQCILFDGENISFDASPVMFINSTNIPPIMIINRIYEYQNLLSL